MGTYADFLSEKLPRVPSVGFTPAEWTAPLFPFQRDIGKALEQHFQAKTPVQIVSEDDGYGGQAILEVEPYSGGAQGLPGMEEL